MERLSTAEVRPGKSLTSPPGRQAEPFRMDDCLGRGDGVGEVGVHSQSRCGEGRVVGRERNETGAELTPGAKQDMEERGSPDG